MTRLDDPALVAREYADDARLRNRASVYQGPDAHDPALEAIVAARPRRVLEVGCGWGAFAARIASATSAEVVALDLSPHMVDLALARGLDARVGDVQALPFDDGAFDAVVAAWMLYHVPDLQQGLAEIARVLAPGGLLVAITNARGHLHELRELVGSGPSPLKFHRENGAELLRASFARVERIDVDGTVEFPTRAEVEQYVRASIAMSPFAGNLPETIDEPLVASRLPSVFLATT